MKKLFILLAAVLTGLVAQAQTDVTMVDNIGDYTGSDAYVYNKADGKVYVKNNLGDYERYGVYPKVATLKVAGGGDTDIDYIATTDNMSNMPYINTGYTHKADTRVVVECDLSTKSNTWQAVYGARANVTSQGFIFFCRFDGNNQGCYVRDWQEKRGDADLPRGEKITIDAQGKFCYVYDKDGTLVSTIETDAVDGTSEGDRLSVDTETGTIVNETTGQTFQAELAGMVGKVGGCTTQFLSLGEHVPKRFPNTYNKFTHN